MLAWWFYAIFATVGVWETDCVAISEDDKVVAFDVQEGEDDVFPAIVED